MALSANSSVYPQSAHTRPRSWDRRLADGADGATRTAGAMRSEPHWRQVWVTSGP